MQTNRTSTKSQNMKKNWIKRAYCALFILGILTCVTVVSVVAIIIVTTVNTSKLNSTQRFCIVATALPPFGSDSGSNGVLEGPLIFRVDDDQINFNFHYTNLQGTGTITSIHIKGPVPEGQLFAPNSLTAPLCGPPSTVACDILTPNKIDGSINSLQPSETSLEPVIRSILSTNSRHYIQINTAEHNGIGNNGELIGRINRECGKEV